MLERRSSGLSRFAESLEELPAPRSEVNREHLLVDVIVISICTVIAGAEGATDDDLPIKGNQSQLEQVVTDFFAAQMADGFARVKVSGLETTQTHHGRAEQRTYHQVNVPQNFPGAERWKGLRTLGLVVRTREINGLETDKIQCSISSLKRNMRLFAKAALGHWGIENPSAADH
jgi:hypothetical protein